MMLAFRSPSSLRPSLPCASLCLSCPPISCHCPCRVSVRPACLVRLRLRPPLGSRGPSSLVSSSAPPPRSLVRASVSAPASAVAPPFSLGRSRCVRLFSFSRRLFAPRAALVRACACPSSVGVPVARSLPAFPLLGACCLSASACLWSSLIARSGHDAPCCVIPCSLAAPPLPSSAPLSAVRSPAPVPAVSESVTRLCACRRLVFLLASRPAVLAVVLVCSSACFGSRGCFLPPLPPAASCRLPLFPRSAPSALVVLCCLSL